MEPPLSPPVRIHPISTTPITAKAACKRIQSFLEDTHLRSGAAGQSGNTTVMVQLQKLVAALKEERKKMAA